MSLLSRPRDNPLEGGELLFPLDQELMLDHEEQRTPRVQGGVLNGPAKEGRGTTPMTSGTTTEPSKSEGNGVVGEGAGRCVVRVVGAVVAESTAGSR